MSRRKVEPEAYIQFLLASPSHFTCVEAARVHPLLPDPPAHDAYGRLLTDLEPDPEALWQEAHAQVDPRRGVIVLDDTTLDKPYARRMGLVGWHWSGKHQRPVKGINLLTLLWTDGDRHVPCDYALYDKGQDGLTKNDHFARLLRQAKERGFDPECVVFDSWYASLDNLKLLRGLGFRWLTRLKCNRKVRVDFGCAQAIATVDIPGEGRVVYLPGYGEIRVFRVDAKDGDTDYWATDDLAMGALTRLRLADFSWRIEEYHRGLKQHTGVQGCQVRRAVGQRNHIGLAIRAFLRLEVYCFRRGFSWLHVTLDIIRDAVRAYLAHPYIRLNDSA